MRWPATVADWLAACPGCRSELGRVGSHPLTCSGCGARYASVDGVWRFLAPGRERHYADFLRDYTAVRLAEGRGSDDPGWYRRLPEPSAGDPLAWQWSIRARTWRHMMHWHVRRWQPGRVVVDLGAGVGWLSHRLAVGGHHPFAVDLSVDDRDGLGAARHYDPEWPVVQAEFDRLPLVDAQADVVVFNASLHYSVDYVATLREAARVLKPGGRIYILDSPLYRRDETGRRMAAERHADFEQRFGTRSDSVPSIEYLTPRLLDDACRRLGLRRSMTHPWYGVQWALRPWKARVRRRRPPSRFKVIVLHRR